jgi:antigen flippase
LSRISCADVFGTPLSYARMAKVLSSRSLTGLPVVLGRLTGAIDKAIAGTAVTNIACAVFGSAGGLLLARLLGAGSRGDLAIAIAWPIFAAWLFALGLPQAICFYTARRPANAGAFVVATSVMSLWLGVVGTTVGWLFASEISGNPIVGRSLREMFLAVPLYMLAVVWTAALQAVNVKLWNFARLVQPICYLLALILLGVLGSLTVETAVRGLIVSVIGAATFSGVAVYILVGMARPKYRDYSSLMEYGLRSALAGAPSVVNIRVDQLILSVTVSSAALGQYVLAASLTYLALPVSTAFGYVAFPRIARLRDQTDARILERQALLSSVATSVLVLVPLAIIAPFAFPLFFGSSYSDSVPLFMILAPATVVLCFNRVAGDTLSGRGKPLVPAVAESVGAVVTIMSLLILIPAIGVVGAAAASLIAYLTVAAILLPHVRDQSTAGTEDSRDRLSDELLPPSDEMLLRRDSP